MNHTLRIFVVGLLLSMIAGCSADSGEQNSTSTKPASEAAPVVSKTEEPAEITASIPPANPPVPSEIQRVAAPSVSNSPPDNVWITAHNGHRSKMGLSGLTWSNELSAFAQEWAAKLVAEQCGGMQHRSGEFRMEHDIGENIALASSNPEPPTHGPDFAVDQWAAEEQFYDYASNSCQPGQVCGHYTQVVWRNSKAVGCGEATCSDGDWKTRLWVCNYRPAGNMMGEKPY